MLLNASIALYPDPCPNLALLDLRKGVNVRCLPCQKIRVRKLEASPDTSAPPRAIFKHTDAGRLAKM